MMPHTRADAVEDLFALNVTAPSLLTAAGLDPDTVAVSNTTKPHTSPGPPRNPTRSPPQSPDR